MRHTASRNDTESNQTRPGHHVLLPLKTAPRFKTFGILFFRNAIVIGSGASILFMIASTRFVVNLANESAQLSGSMLRSKMHSLDTGLLTNEKQYFGNSTTDELVILKDSLVSNPMLADEYGRRSNIELTNQIPSLIIIGTQKAVRKVYFIV